MLGRHPRPRWGGRSGRWRRRAGAGPHGPGRDAGEPADGLAPEPADRRGVRLRARRRRHAPQQGRPPRRHGRDRGDGARRPPLERRGRRGRRLRARGRDHQRGARGLAGVARRHRAAGRGAGAGARARGRRRGAVPRRAARRRAELPRAGEARGARPAGHRRRVCGARAGAGGRRGGPRAARGRRGAGAGRLPGSRGRRRRGAGDRGADGGARGERRARHRRRGGELPARGGPARVGAAAEAQRLGWRGGRRLRRFGCGLGRHRGHRGVLRRRQGRRLGLGLRVRAKRRRLDRAAEAHRVRWRGGRRLRRFGCGLRRHRGHRGVPRRRQGRRLGLGLRVRAKRRRLDPAEEAHRLGWRGVRLLRPVGRGLGRHRGHRGVLRRRPGIPLGLGLRVRAKRRRLDPAEEAHRLRWRGVRLLRLFGRGLGRHRGHRDAP